MKAAVPHPFLRRYLVVLPFVLGLGTPAAAQDEPSVAKAPTRARGEGPFDRLVIRGATLIDGTGAPAIGPVDIVVARDRIAQISVVGVPGSTIAEEARPSVGSNDRVIEAEGMFVLPGFVDAHAHIGFTMAGGEGLPAGMGLGTPAEYVFKLWMAHGVTTVREPGSGNGLAWTLDEKRRSADNEITAPRIEAYVRFARGHNGPITTPEQARAWVAEVAGQGADGLKLGTLAPGIMAATIDEARKRGLRTMAHLDQMGVARMNVLEAAQLGLTSMEHWYGLPEALFTARTVQNYPLDYNYSNEQDRFQQAGRLWRQAAAPYSDHWSVVLEELLELDFTLVPTFSIYEASRDLMRMRRAEWHDTYTLPLLWEWFRPNRISHGSYWFYWTTEDEVAWKNNYRLWMSFVNEYKNRGGRVAVGSDAGFIYSLYGFAFVREMELLREAGFHPLEVIRSATLMGAELLDVADDVGTIRVGKLADLVLVEENPLANLKVLYGTGAIKLDDNNVPRRVGGVRYTIKDGVVYDARELLSDVERMVREAKEQQGYEIVQPGMRRR